MKKFLVTSLVCALLAPAAMSAADFEGTVSMKMSGRETAGKATDGTMNFSLKGGLTRLDTSAQGMSVGIIMDPAKQQMTMLMTQQQMYMVRPIPAPAAAPAAGTGEKSSQPSLEKTSVTEKILGYDCVKYVTKDDKGKTTELWLTDQLGAFMGFGGGGPMGRRGGGSPASQGWEQLLQDKSLFPMRVVSLEAGKEIGRMEVTAVDKKSLPDSLFTVPDGWQDMSAMMRGMGAPGGMPPGMRPPGGN